MIAEKRLTKENDAALWTYTIAVEEWIGEHWKFRVTVWKDKWPKDGSAPSPDIRTYGFTTKKEAEHFAANQEKDFIQFGFA
jgi:hypothetical protein